MARRLTFPWAVAVVVFVSGTGRGHEAISPREVKVLPVFFVPKGEPAPTVDQKKRLMQHVEWSRTRYRELLRNQVTFGVAEKEPRVYQSNRPLAFFRAQTDIHADHAAHQVSELLAELKTNRWRCPYVLLVVTMNPKDDFPVAGGRPLNGGYNTGGGIIQISSFALDHHTWGLRDSGPNIQSTLQHELGHGFGLRHVDVYGYDLESNPSIMSYNKTMWTNGFKPSQTPGIMIPEDLRGLALNQRAFAKLQFDPKTDVPQGYSLAAQIVPFGPMEIPGQPGVKVTTDSGEDFGSKVTHIVQGQILESTKTGKVTYDGSKMWASAKSKTGWVAVQVTFPFEVELTRLAVHSQHSGEYHAAHAVCVSVKDSGGRFQPVVKADLQAVDDMVNLPKTKGQEWQFEFKADETGIVTLRGLQFFSGDDELFPTLVPFRR